MTDTINPPSPDPTEQLSSLLTPGENPGPFPDYIPYESWPVKVVSASEQRSDTYLPSHMQELGDFLTRLDRSIKDLLLLGKMQADLMQQMTANQKQTAELLMQMIQEMADEDGDDEPRTYMDGSRI